MKGFLGIIFALFSFFGIRSEDIESNIQVEKKDEKIVSSSLDNLKEISLLSEIGENKIINFEKNVFVMSFSRSDFELEIKEFYEDFSLKDDKDLLEFLEEEFEQKDIIDYYDISSDLRYRIDSCISNLLEKGRVLIFDNKNQKYLEKIKMETFSNCSTNGTRDVCSSGGRRFLDLNGKEIFEIEDWMY